MKTLLQSGLNGRVAAPPEKRFPITTFLGAGDEARPRHFRRRGPLVALLLASACLSTVVRSETLTISKPISRQVFQRDAQDHAAVILHGTVSSGVDVIEAKATLLEGATAGEGTDWVFIAGPVGGGFEGALSLQAGGWYKVTVRARKGAQVVAETTVDKIGAGEIFVTAGQSNSANWGSPRQTATDGRVVYFNGVVYVSASDPIPGGTGSGGSPWPILGDLIARSEGVPVCFRSASLTWTEVKNWMPGVTYDGFQLYNNLVNCVGAFPQSGVRAVLWHQGESDSLAKTSAATYCDRLKTIIEALKRDGGYQLPWIVAQASFHPGAPEADPKEVARGQQMLWAQEIAFQGPNTDDLLGSGYRHDGVHFNQAGLNAHAERWFLALNAANFFPDRNLPPVIDSAPWADPNPTTTLSTTVNVQAHCRCPQETWRLPLEPGVLPATRQGSSYAANKAGPRISAPSPVRAAVAAARGTEQRAQAEMVVAVVAAEELMLLKQAGLERTATTAARMPEAGLIKSAVAAVGQVKLAQMELLAARQVKAEMDYPAAFVVPQ